MKDFLISTQQSLPDFLNPSNTEGTIQSIIIVFNTIVSVMFMAIFLGILLLLFRYPLRTIHHAWRMRHIGGVRWYEVFYSGGSNEERMKKAGSQVSNTKRLMDNRMNNSLPIYTSRGITSLVFKKSREDDKAHFYLAVDNQVSDNEIRTWASDANCSVEEVDFEDIGFHPGAPVVATNGGYALSDLTKEPHNDTVGGVMSALQGTIGDEYGTFMISYEPMRVSEKKLLATHMRNKAIKEEGGNAAVFNGDGRNISIITGSEASRAVILAFSDDDDTRTSSTILNIAVGSIPALGVMSKLGTFPSIHRSAGMSSLLATIFLAVGSYLGYISWVATIVSAVCSLAVMMGLPIMSEFWVKRYSSNGVAAIPPFWRYSLRRIAQQAWTSINPFDVDSGSMENNNGSLGSENYIREPSCKEVIPVYRTSIMQAASMPMNEAFTANLSMSAIPQIAVEKSTNKRIKDYIISDDVIFTGTSAGAGNDPVFRTVDDLNFGVAYGGVAGSGKTNALRNDFLGASRMARKETGIAGEYYINPIWFEVKPDDISAIVNTVKDYDPLVIKLHDETSPRRLALEGRRINEDGVTVKEVMKSRSGLVKAMEAVFGSDGMGPQSKQVANASATVAMLTTPAEIERLGIADKVRNIEKPNIMTLMYYLINGDPSRNMDKKVENLLSDKMSEIAPENIDSLRAEMGSEEVTRVKTLSSALEYLLSMLRKKDAVDPLKNKLLVLMESDGLFEPYRDEAGKDLREDFDMTEIYNYGGPVVLDMTAQGSSMSQSSTEIFTMMVHYMMWESIQNNCQGWGPQHRYIPLFADEVTYFAGNAQKNKAIGECATLISTMRNLGRSFGVSHSVGFQEFGQMTPETKRAILGFESLIILQMNNAEDFDIAMKQIGNGTMFTESNFKYFPKGVGAVTSLLVGGQSVRPFAISTPYSVEWSKALSSSKNSWSAFKKIRDQEVEKIKQGRKSKISTNSESLDDLMTARDIYGADDDSYMDDSDDSIDDGPQLSWG